MRNGWIVCIPKKVKKAIEKLPDSAQKQMFSLLKDIRFEGPIGWNWKNYGKLGNNTYHCYIRSGRPTYVCCCRSVPKLKFVEIFYAGTHENAPY